MPAAPCVACAAACPDATWRENPATGKCYKLMEGYVSHFHCAAICGTEASLACVQDSTDNEFFTTWMLHEGIPGTPRTMFWIANYAYLMVLESSEPSEDVHKASRQD